MNNRKSDKYLSNNSSFTAGAFANVCIKLGDKELKLNTPLRKRKDVSKNIHAFHPALIKASKQVHKTWLAWDALSKANKSKTEEPPRYLVLKKNIEITVIPNNKDGNKSIDTEDFLGLM